MIDAFTFDLDDTLYPERDFVSGGYRAAAQHLSHRYGLPFSVLFDTMMTTFINSGRKEVFPSVISRFLLDSVPVSELVEIYRAHFPRIQLLPGYSDLLEGLRCEFRLGIITDGLPAVQRNKVRALGLQRFVDKIIYTWDCGPEHQKPHPLAFELMLRELETEPSRALYVGDNPDKDCAGAHAAGMKFAWVRGAGRIEIEACPALEDADFVIDSLLQLPQILHVLD